MLLGKGVPLKRGRERGASRLKSVTLSLLGRLAWKWLQLITDMLLIITSTGD